MAWRKLALCGVGGDSGAYIVIGEIVRPVKAKCTGLFHVRTKSFGYQFCQGVCTFVLFVLSLVFFRADTVAVCGILSATSVYDI